MLTKFSNTYYTLKAFVIINKSASLYDEEQLVTFFTWRKKEKGAIDFAAIEYFQFSNYGPHWDLNNIDSHRLEKEKEKRSRPVISLEPTELQMLLNSSNFIVTCTYTQSQNYRDGLCHSITRAPKSLMSCIVFILELMSCIFVKMTWLRYKKKGIK